jgi:transcriptional regulator with XRE-family HTH domain
MSLRMTRKAGDVSWLRQERIDAGMTQAALARAAGLSSPMLCEFETGRRRAPPEVVERLAKAFGQSPDLGLLVSGYAPEWLVEGLAEHPELIEKVRKMLKEAK